MERSKIEPLIEQWQRLDALRNEATVRFDLRLEAKEGVRIFKVYFVGKDDGRTQVGFEDYWVRVERDTAEVSGNEHFKKQSRSTTDIGTRVDPIGESYLEKPNNGMHTVEDSIRQHSHR